MQNNVTVNPLFHPGDSVGRYRVEAFLGQGAFAQVYHVTHLGLNAPRAVKLLRRDMPGVGSSDYHDCLLRFQLEAQLGAQLDHPHLIRVYDFEQVDDTLLLVMEYALNGSLADRLKAQGPLPVGDALRIARELAEGLAALHTLDAVHRDLKPSNILFDAQGRAKVADLGLAQIPHGPSDRAQQSAPLPHPGTPAYMSPEQRDTREHLTPASDIYALGAVLFEALTGRVYKNQRPGTDARTLRADVPEGVAALLARMLSKEPEARPWDGAEAAPLLQAEEAAYRQWVAEQAMRQQGEAAEVARRQWEAAEAVCKQREAEVAARKQQEAEEAVRKQREAAELARRQSEAEVAVGQQQASRPDLTGFPKPIRSAPERTPTKRQQARRQREESLARRLRLAVAGMIGFVFVILVIAALLRGGDDQSTATPSPEPIGSATMIMTTSIITQERIATPPSSEFMATPRPTITPTVTAEHAITHTVQTGENIPRIALSYNTSVESLCKANNITNMALIYVGQVLTIPISAAPIATPSTTITPEVTVKNAITHTVQAGENMFRIALRYGTTVNLICKANNMEDPTLMYVGQVLIIPVLAAPTATPTREPTLTSTATPLSLPKLGDTWTRPADTMVMLYVPAGEFQMGSTDEQVQQAVDLCVADGYPKTDCAHWFANEQPRHTVLLDAFWIDRIEVTNAQYQKCVDAGACIATAYKNDRNYNGDAQPVVGVDWTDAQAYCEWAGGQLPTEAQWEYAARGAENRVFPWGNTFDGTKVNYCDKNCIHDWADRTVDDGHSYAAPVGSYTDGASWVGALDMAGNVWEWTADWYGDYSSEKQKNPIGATTGQYRVLRGGSWRNLVNDLRSTDRSGNLPSYKADYVGFRCLVARQRP